MEVTLSVVSTTYLSIFPFPLPNEFLHHFVVHAVMAKGSDNDEAIDDIRGLSSPLRSLSTAASSHLTYKNAALCEGVTEEDVSTLLRLTFTPLHCAQWN